MGQDDKICSTVADINPTDDGPHESLPLKEGEKIKLEDGSLSNKYTHQVVLEGSGSAIISSDDRANSREQEVAKNNNNNKHKFNLAVDDDDDSTSTKYKNEMSAKKHKGLLPEPELIQIDDDSDDDNDADDCVQDGIIGMKVRSPQNGRKL